MSPAAKKTGLIKIPAKPKAKTTVQAEKVQPARMANAGRISEAKLRAAAQDNAPEQPRQKIIRDKEFGRRLESACDGNPHIPGVNKGRLTWFKNQLGERFGEKISIETVRKWFAGEVKPRPDKLKLLAEILEVDEAWLSLGVSPDLQPRERKLRNAMADGAVNLLAGVIQMNGGSPAFPEEGDKRAVRDQVDLYAIIKGAQYAFHVSLAQSVGPKEFKFTLPANYDGAFQIGIIQEESTKFQFVELNEGIVEGQGVRKGGSIEVTARESDLMLRRIVNFRDRL